MSQLIRFVAIMDRKLGENAHKGGWSRCSDTYLLRRLGQESAELRKAIKNGASAEEIAREAADVANFAMMIADVHGGLE